MDPDHKLRIQLNLTALLEDLDATDVLPQLIQDGVFTFDDREKILKQITRKDCAMKLLEMLLTKGPTAYSAFRKSLLDCNCHLVDMLDATEIINENLPDKLKDKYIVVQNELQEHYEHSLVSISPLQWCEWFRLDFDKIYTQLELFRRNAFFNPKMSQCSSRKQSITTEIGSLFKSHQESSSPNRILIEGSPGIGKSTLCQKIAFDWCKTNKSDIGGTKENITNDSISYLNTFKLVFLLSAREIKTSITDTIYEHILPEDFAMAKDEFEKLVQNNQREVLFVIDGFDEMKDPGNIALTKLIQRRILPHSTVMLTSRPHHAESLFKYFDSFFHLKGYSEAHMISFIEKYSEDMKVPSGKFSQLINKIDIYTSMKDVCRNPLNLCFLCILCEERDGILPNSKTEIYDEIVDLILMKAATKLNLPKEELLSHVDKLCELALSGLQDGKYSFPAHLLQCKTLVGSLGFLTKELSMSRLRNEPMYVFTHKSFQEYLAAKHMASLPTKQRLLHIQKFLRAEGLSTMWVFYAGLIRNNESLLSEFMTAIRDQSVFPAESEDTAKKRFGILNIPGNIPFRLITVLDIWDRLQALCFRCIKELTLENVSSKLLSCIEMCIPTQLTFDYSVDSRYALTGFLHFLKVTKVSRNYQLLISSHMFNNEHEKYINLLREIAHSAKIDTVKLHMIATIDELKTAFQVFQIGSSFSTVNALHMKFISILSCRSEETLGDLKLGPAINCIELTGCNNVSLTAHILKELALNCRNLTSLVVNSCTVDDSVLNSICVAIKTLVSLSKLNFTFNYIQCADRESMLKVLCAIEDKSGLTSLALSDVHKNPTSFSNTENQKQISLAFASTLKNIIKKNKLEHFHISRTNLPKVVVSALGTLANLESLRSLDVIYCFINCPDEFNKFIENLGKSSKLSQLDIHGSSIRYMPEQETSAVTLMPFNTEGATNVPVSPNHLREPFKPRSSSANRLLESRQDGTCNHPIRFKFDGLIKRCASVPDGMLDKIIMSTANNARSDERSETIHILHGMVAATKHLTSLTVSDLHATHLTCLCKGLEQNTSLQSLALICSNLNKGCTPALCSFLEKHPCIEEFGIGRSNINGLDIETFLESVRKCKPLRTLGLNHCLFHDKYMAPLAKTIKDNLCICNVILRDNSKVTCDGVRILYDGLQGRSQQLKIVDLSDCGVKKHEEVIELMKEVALLVKVNWF